MASSSNPEGFNVEVGSVPQQEVAPPTELTPPDTRPYSGDAGGANPVRVSTEAIDWFINQLNTIAPDDGSGLVEDAINAVRAVDIRPGAFAIAQVLKSKIDGEGGLKGDTISFLEGLGELLIVLRDSLTTVSRNYRETEDDSTITGDELNEHMTDANSIINGWNDSGQAEWQNNSPPPKNDGSQGGSGGEPPAEGSDTWYYQPADD
jgi:hypothetical protein